MSNAKKLWSKLKGGYKVDMIAHMEQHPEDLPLLISCAFVNETNSAWRACWLLWHCTEENDALLKPQLPKMVELLPMAEESHQRELLRILLKMEIDEKQEGLLFHHCVDLWIKREAIPSLRHNALVLILRIAKKHRELIPEVEQITEKHYMETLTHGVRRSMEKRLKSFYKSIGL